MRTSSSCGCSSRERHERLLGGRDRSTRCVAPDAGDQSSSMPRDVAGIGARPRPRDAARRLETGDHELGEIAHRVAPAPGSVAIGSTSGRTAARGGECSRGGLHEREPVIDGSARAAAPAQSERLHVELDAPLPREMWRRAVNGAVRMRLVLSPAGADRGLSVEADGARHPVMAWGMPRLDPFASSAPGSRSLTRRRSRRSCVGRGSRRCAATAAGSGASCRSIGEPGGPPLELGLHARAR